MRIKAEKKKLESHIGKTYREQDRIFPIYAHDSMYLQERSRREALYNSLSFPELHASIGRITSAHFTRPAAAYAEAVRLDAILTPTTMFCEPGGPNPLDESQKQKIASLLDSFKSLLTKKTADVEHGWKDLESRLTQKSISVKYASEKIVQADALTEEYLQWASFSWLGGEFRVAGDESIVDYGQVVHKILHLEEKFWQGYLQKYQSKVFADAKELEAEQEYLNQVYREQFAFSSWQAPLQALRLRMSLPYRLLQEMNGLKAHLAPCNEIKLFLQAKLRHLEEDKKNLLSVEKSLDYLTELKSKYPLLSQHFPGSPISLLYVGSLASAYEQQREDFYKALREEELSMEQQRTAERKSRSSHFSHPLIISLEPFDISAYVRRYTPSTDEMRNLQKLLLGADPWEKKMEQLVPLLEKKPSFYSERDKDFLHSVIFALKTSQSDGVLEHLCREKPALNQKIGGVLSALHAYAQHYVS